LALVCESTIAGRRVVAYNLHLESKGDDALRCSQLEETLEDARRYEVGTPIVLAGDFNFDVSGGSASTAIRQAQFQDAFANQHGPRHRTRSWNPDEASTGFLSEDRFMPPVRQFIAPSAHLTIFRYRRSSLCRNSLAR
jgi:endonuclease/exonuclease/phosphatase family metal-dependent hydrolase